MDWFLHNRDICHERVKNATTIKYINFFDHQTLRKKTDSRDLPVTAAHNQVCFQTVY